MGVSKEISHNTFPKQGTWLWRKVMVCFNYDLSHQIEGQIVREDDDSPITIIKLVDGRHVLSTECQYSLAKEGKAN